MKIIFNSDVLKWINEEWDLTLDWDTGNMLKLVKHHLTVEEVEEVFDGMTVFAGQIIPSSEINWGEERFLSIGSTDKNRFVTIVWTRRLKSIRPISARAARKNEKELYEEKTK